MTHQKAKIEAIPTRDVKHSLDQVQEDGVMKEIFRKEEQTRRNWESNWGFMKNRKELWMDEARRRGLSENLFRKCSPKLLPEFTTHNITLQKSNQISPKSSGVIGWRSSVKENDYNRFVGPLYISLRLSMNPPVSEDEPDLNKQRFIFLG